MLHVMAWQAYIEGRHILIRYSIFSSKCSVELECGEADGNDPAGAH